MLFERDLLCYIIRDTLAPSRRLLLVTSYSKPLAKRTNRNASKMPNPPRSQPSNNQEIRKDEKYESAVLTVLTAVVFSTVDHDHLPPPARVANYCNYLQHYSTYFFLYGVLYAVLSVAASLQE